MSVLVATAHMDEAEGFDWLVAMDAGRVLATGSPAELKARTASATLEQAFISLLPDDKPGETMRQRVSDQIDQYLFERTRIAVEFQTTRLIDSWASRRSFSVRVRASISTCVPTHAQALFTASPDAGGGVSGVAGAPDPVNHQPDTVRSGAQRGSVRVKIVPSPVGLAASMVPPSTPVTRL